jgi:pimeloyl-ACP methyl ester carboxylesterase
MSPLCFLLLVAIVYLSAVTLFLGGLYLARALDPRCDRTARGGSAFRREWLGAICTQSTLPLCYFIWPARWERSTRPGEIPVVFVHGWGQNRGDFLVMAARFQAQGRGALLGFNYWFTSPIARSAARLGTYVDRVLARTGASQVHLVTHSLGGVVARYYVERLHGATSVRSVTLVASPLAGTHRARLGLSASSRELRPGSAFLAALGPPAAPAGVCYHAVLSRADALVVPPSSASLRGAGPELEVDHLGHLSLLLDRRVAAQVLAWIGESEAAAGEPSERSPGEPVNS